MGKLFNYDSPFMQRINKIGDLIILNILTIFCSLPIVTLGAAVTAMYDALYRMQKDEGGVYKAFFRAFKSNFRQATLMWLILLVLGLLIGGSLIFYFQVTSLFGKILTLVSIVLAFLWCAAAAWVFPLQSRFENTMKNTLRNSLLCSVAYLPRTFPLVILNMTPWFLLMVFPSVFLRISVAWVLIWFSLAAYLNLIVLKKPFQILMGETT